jgi:hypothetical protein
MTESGRVPCKTPGCPVTIQPATAARNGGYCAPCAAKAAAAEHKAYVKANRRTVDRFAGVTDPVDMLKLMHNEPKYDELVDYVPPPKSTEELYTSLSAEDAKRVITWIVENIDTNAAEDAAQNLSAFTDYSLDDLLPYWLERREPYPAIIFRKAGPAIRDRLIALLGSSTASLKANHTLCALAWIGDQTVADFLRRATAETHSWREELHITPADYARIGGWELAPTGRRELTYPACVAIKPAKGQTPTNDVALFQPAAGTCPWCKNALKNLIQMSTSHPPLSAWAELGPSIDVVTCTVCTCFGTVHAKLDAAGHGTWSEKNQRPSYLPENSEPADEPFAEIPLQLQPRPPMHSAEWLLPTTHTQIGGHPGWVQDMDYPACHGCGQTMKFLAQIDVGDLPAAEGFYYAFICPTCRTTATNYQQT